MWFMFYRGGEHFAPLRVEETDLGDAISKAAAVLALGEGYYLAPSDDGDSILELSAAPSSMGTVAGKFVYVRADVAP